MASHEAYLRSALAQYRYADQAKRDIMGAVTQYNDLRPRRDHFVFNDGNKKELLCLDGTIPCTYKGTVYNIPVCLWLLETHPHNPPMGFVKPTSTMQIKPGKHVDSNGRVYLPYLHDWKHPQSDLLGLIQVLAIVFGEDPPVYSRSAAPPRTAHPPYPSGGPAPAGSIPYPPAGGGMPMPSFPGAAGPRYPPATGPGYPSAGGAGYPPAYPPAYPPQAAAQQHPPYPPTTGYQPYPSFGQQATQGQNPGYPSATNPATTTSNSNTLQLTDEQVRASLVTAVEDKMRRRLKEIFAQASAEMDSLKKTQDDLQKGKQSLDGMIQKLEHEQNDVERNTTLLQEKNEEMEAALMRMENSSDTNIDDAVVPTAPLYKQILTAFAEEQATEDVIYYLGEALRKEMIDLEVFLKQIRGLSRRQFMLRALISKCREKAGLPDASG